MRGEVGWAKWAHKPDCMKVVGQNHCMAGSATDHAAGWNKPHVFPKQKKARAGTPAPTLANQAEFPS